MKITQRFVIAGVATLLLNACASQGQSPTRMASNFINNESVIPTSNADYPAKDPQTVALYQNNDSPHAPYRIIGMASVMRHNLLGMERTDATMQQMMKQLAANMGGDGLINVDKNPDALKAHIIAYQQILI